MRPFRAVVAILVLVLTMPLAHARAVISSAPAAQPICCKQKADACCDGSAKVCCETQAPAIPCLFPSHGVSPLLLPPRTIKVVHTDHIDNLTPHLTATRLPAEFSPPGLMMVGTTLLRI